MLYTTFDFYRDYSGYYPHAKPCGSLEKPVPDLIFFTVSSKNVKFILKCS